MLPSQAPRYYAAGVLLSAMGALLLALRIRRRGKPTPKALLVIGVETVLVFAGVAIIGIGLQVDEQYYAYLNTTRFSYQVLIRMNASGPVRLVLPAPSDPRLFDAMNVTNGSASLRLNNTATETNVVLTADGNVSFEVRAQVPSASVDWGFTRLTFEGPCYEGPTCNAAIEMSALSPDFGVVLTLYASIGSGCSSLLLQIEAPLEPGASEYPAQALMATC